MAPIVALKSWAIMVDFSSGNFSPPQGGCSSYSTLTAVVKTSQLPVHGRVGENSLYLPEKKSVRFVGDLVALLHFSCVLYSPYLLFRWPLFPHLLINDEKGTTHTLLLAALLVHHCGWDGGSFSNTVPFCTDAAVALLEGNKTRCRYGVLLVVWQSMEILTYSICTSNSNVRFQTSISNTYVCW
jgi:hypothetical protein